MSQNIVLTFALLFAATICVICAIYTALIFRRTKKREVQ